MGNLKRVFRQPQFSSFQSGDPRSFSIIVRQAEILKFAPPADKLTIETSASNILNMLLVPDSRLIPVNALKTPAFMVEVSLKHTARKYHGFGIKGSVRTSAFVCSFISAMDAYFTEARRGSKSAAFRGFKKRVFAGFKLRLYLAKYNASIPWNSRLGGLHKLADFLDGFQPKKAFFHDRGLGRQILMHKFFCGTKSNRRDLVTSRFLEKALSSSTSMEEFLVLFTSRPEKDIREAA